MSLHLGPLRQNGYVVPDLDAAIEGWLDLGVGPWIVYPHAPFEDFVYQGHPGELDVSIALANSGPLQIELIDQHDSSPSLYRDFLEANPAGGLQHLGYWVDDYDDVHQHCLDLGWTVGHEGSIADCRFTYFDTEFHGGTIMEIAAMNEERRASFARIEQMAAEWNGVDRPTRVIDLSSS
ncbi:MAG: VOC family protein [Actinomycetia bacterium]|nr:VOC family protein [Actinomycetes bacterium]